MRIRVLTWCVAAVLGSGAIGATASGPGSDMVVHEWGTFLAMNGSDGVALDGMYHEEHALPGFVHARSSDQLRLRSAQVKGETPVIYFYAKRREQVTVEVGFPAGLWTQWYPQASLVGPALAQIGSPPRARNGRIGWAIDVVPPSLASPTLPSASADALWHYARDVDASFVSAVDQTRPGAPREWERFIFYRGLGEAGLPLDVSAGSGHVTARATSTGVRHLYVLRVEGGKGSYRYTPSLDAGGTIRTGVPSMDDAQPLDRFTQTIAEDLAGRLVESGLYEREARAMVNTWRTSYFTTEGIRVLFVLPQSWTDRYIPLRIAPAPSELVRVMVGRVEVLTPEREQEAESSVRDLSSPDRIVRETAFLALQNMGRYIEPIIRRTLHRTRDEGVRTLCRRLLSTDFVTEIRTSLTNAATGTTLPRNPGYERAQRAGLLRLIGVVKETE